MTSQHECPECGARLALSRVRPVGANVVSKRRDCATCGYADRIHLVEEIRAIIRVAKRAKRNKKSVYGLKPAKAHSQRPANPENESMENKSC